MEGCCTGYRSRVGRKRKISGLLTNFSGGINDEVEDFLYKFLNVVMRGRSDEEKAHTIFMYLEGDAKRKYKEKFIEGWKLKDCGQDLGNVCEWFVSEFGKKVELDVLIRDAVEAKLDFKDLLSSLHKLCEMYQNAGFNERAKFGLLRKKAMENTKLSEFLLIKGPHTFDSVKETIMQFVNNSKMFASYHVDVRKSSDGSGTYAERELMAGRVVGTAVTRAVRAPGDLRYAEKRVQTRLDRSLEQKTPKLEGITSIIKKGCQIEEFFPDDEPEPFVRSFLESEHQNPVYAKRGSGSLRESTVLTGTGPVVEISLPFIGNEASARGNLQLMKRTESSLTSVSSVGHVSFMEEVGSTSTIGRESGSGRKPKFTKQVRRYEPQIRDRRVQRKVIQRGPMLLAMMEKEEEGKYSGRHTPPSAMDSAGNCTLHIQESDQRGELSSARPCYLVQQKTERARPNAVPTVAQSMNPISSDVGTSCRELTEFKPVERSVKVIDVSTSNAFVQVEEAIISFGTKAGKGIVVGKDTPFDVGIGCRTMEVQKKHIKVGAQVNALESNERVRRYLIDHQMHWNIACVFIILHLILYFNHLLEWNCHLLSNPGRAETFALSEGACELAN